MDPKIYNKEKLQMMRRDDIKFFWGGGAGLEGRNPEEGEEK